MNKIIILFLSLTLLSCNTSVTNSKTDKSRIISTLDQWHQAAAEAEFENYFSLLTDDAVFMGTDATENWNKTEFMAFAKPYFDKGKAWNFTAMERHIYFDATGNMAWFDELLNTQMKICRGSGVLVKVDDEWRMKQYVLSMTIPNGLSNDIVKIKTPADDVLIIQLQKE